MYSDTGDTVGWLPLRPAPLGPRPASYELPPSAVALAAAVAFVADVPQGLTCERQAIRLEIALERAIVVWSTPS